MNRHGAWARSLAVGGILAATTLSTRSALAETTPNVRLSYEAEQGIHGCFDEAAFRDAVRERLPFDPFAPSSDALPITVTARIARDDAQLRASIALEEDAAGEATQEIVAGPDECETLSIAAALAVAMTIERSIAQRRSERAASPPPLPRPAPPRRRPPPPRPVPHEVRSWTHAGAIFGAGILPKPSIGAAVGAGVEHGWVSGALEAGQWLPSEVTSPRGGGANASLLFISGKGCAQRSLPSPRVPPALEYERSMLFACAVATVGEFRATGTDLFVSRSAGTLYAAVGLRAGVEVPIVAPLSAVLEGGAVVPLVQRSLRIAEEVLWRAPSIAAELDLHWRVTIFR